MADQLRLTTNYLVAMLSWQHRRQVHGSLFIWLRQVELASLIRSWSFTTFRCGLNLYRHYKSLFKYIQTQNVKRTCLSNRNCNVTFGVLKKHHYIRYRFYPTSRRLPSSTKLIPLHVVALFGYGNLVSRRRSGWCWLMLAEQDQRDESEHEVQHTQYID